MRGGHVECDLAGLDQRGYVILRGLIPPDVIAPVREACPPVGRAGMRNLLERMPQAQAIADAPALRAVAAAALGPRAQLVRAILFDKAPGANWALGFHQDTVIAVAERIDTPGFGPWSIKDGAHHVRPPVAILQAMATIRIHLDPADAAAGALAVLPDTHNAGLLDSAAIRRRVETGSAVSCDVEAGDAVLMRPLLLHGSPRATREACRRRVIHLEFAANPLPAPLRWARA